MSAGFRMGFSLLAFYKAKKKKVTQNIRGSSPRTLGLMKTKFKNNDRQIYHFLDHISGIKARCKKIKNRQLRNYSIFIENRSLLARHFQCSVKRLNISICVLHYFLFGINIKHLKDLVEPDVSL